MGVCGSLIANEFQTTGRGQGDVELKKKKRPQRTGGYGASFSSIVTTESQLTKLKKKKKTSCQMIPEAYTWSKTYSRNGCDVCARTIKRVHIDNKKPEAPREGGAAH